MTRLVREEFLAAAARMTGGGSTSGSDVMTGSAARDWMTAQGG
jgi:hypothetical protein